MSIPARFPNKEEAKKARWFSRRHRTSEASFAERDRYRQRASRKAAGLPQGALLDKIQGRIENER